MIICPHCQKQLEDDSKFCEFCGTLIPEQEEPKAPETEAPIDYRCPHCGQPVSPENQFCPGCGKPVGQFVFCQNCGKPVSTTDTVCPHCSSRLQDDAETPKNKPSKKRLLFAGIGAAVVAVLVLVFVLAGRNTGGSSKNYALYIKDKEIYYTAFSRKDPRQVTSRLTDSNDFDNYDFASGAYLLADACRLSDDGSVLFFPDKLSYSDDGYSLYCRNIDKTKQEASKIDSDVISYSVSKDAVSVTYQKNDTLYQYNRKKADRQRVARDVLQYYVSDDGKNILYLNKENMLYRTVRGGESEKIDIDVSEINYVSDDLSTIVYIKDGNLYRKKGKEDRVRVSSDVYDVIAAYDSGELYYVKSDSSEVPLIDYVYDDKREADAALTEPQPPSWSDPDYDAKYQEYEAAYQEYYAKQERDYLREYLNEEKMELTNYTLCYFDGEAETILSDAFTYSSYTCADDAPAIVYTAYSSDDVNIKLSESEDPYNISSLVTEALYSASEKYVAVGGSASLFDRDEAQNFHLSADGRTLYYFDEVPDNKNYGELYQVSVSSSGEPGSPELYDSDVWTDSFYLIDGGKPLYFKDYKNDKGDMYIDRKKIDYDVNTYSVRYNESSNCVTYYTDWNDKKDYGTLKIYTKKEAEKIADDAHSHFVLPNGEVLYLYDYSQKYYHGDLYLWDKKDSEKIDDSVVCIIPVY